MVTTSTSQTGFDLSNYDSMVDVLNRAGITDKRKRAEAARKGLSDLGTFTKEYQPEVTAAGSDPVFMGAGRQLAANQKVAPEIAELFQGPLTKHGSEWFYYGPDDYSTAQFGWDGYQTKDVGPGKVDILGSTGQSIGTGYKSLDDSIRDYGVAAAEKYITQTPDGWDFSGPASVHKKEFGGNAGGWQNWMTGKPSRDVAPLSSGASGGKINLTGSSKEELMQKLSDIGYFTPEQKDFYGKNRNVSDLQKWEVLGQLLNGGKFVADPSSWRDFGGNARSETVAGLDTLYGSTPLIHKDKLFGYKLGNLIDPAKGGYGQNNPIGQLIRDTHGKTQSSAQLWREYNNEDQWKENLYKLGEDFFVTSDKAANLPGWSNKESYQYHQQEEKDGFLGGLGGLLGAALSFTPLAPLGYGLSAISAIESGNPLSLIGAALGMADGFGAFGDIGSAFGDAANFATGGMGPTLQGAGGLGGTLADLGGMLGGISNFSGIPVSALTNGGMSALSAAIQGGNPLTAGLTSGLSSLFGGAVGKQLGPTAGSLARSGASFGLKSLANKKGRSAGEDVVRNYATNIAPQQNTSTQPTEERKQKHIDPRTLIALNQLYRNRT